MNTRKYFDAMDELLDRLLTERGAPIEARDAAREWKEAATEFTRWFISEPADSDGVEIDEASVLGSLVETGNAAVAAWRRYERDSTATSLAEFLRAMRTGIELRLRWAASGL